MRFGQTISPIAAPAAACGSLLSLGLRGVAGVANVAILFGVRRTNRKLSIIIDQNHSIGTQSGFDVPGGPQGAVVEEVLISLGDENSGGGDSDDDSHSSVDTPA